MSDILDYDKSIVETLHHIEDVLVKFSLQSYASVGIVLASHYASNIPHWIAPVLGIALGGVFLWAICFNLIRYTLVFRMHQITRNQWLVKEQPGLRDALLEDQDCHKNLTTPVRFWKSAWPPIVINSLPIVAAFIQLVIYISSVGNPTITVSE